MAEIRREYNFRSEKSFLIIKNNFGIISGVNARSKFWGLSGSEDRDGVTTVSNSLILGGWVTKILKNGDKKWGGGWKGG